MDATPSSLSGSEPTAIQAGPSLSPFARLVAIFAKPASAWAGLEQHAAWWLPLIIMTLCGVVFTVTLHDRAIMPMITERWEQMVDSGQLSAEQLDKMESGMRGPMGLVMTAVQQVVAWPVIMLLLALLITFGVGFVLGTKLKFRLAFEIANWSSLVLLPSYLITGVLAWQRETLKGIHLGLGALIPQSDPPQRLQVALTSLLDAIGPFNLWFLVVAILGAVALSGAPRKSVTGVMVGLYVALAVFMAAMAAVFTPGS
jgi:Yip1-like protein